MKKSILTLFSIFLWNIGFAQLPVTDAAVNGQLIALNSALSTLNSLMTDQKGTSYDNRMENYKQRILGAKNFDFIKQVEDYMWKADEYLKKGREIQMIYNKEEDILKKLKTIKKNASKYGNSDLGINAVYSVNQTIRGTLSQIGGMVDDAQSILGDKNVRMDTEGRLNILKETLAKLIIVERRLDEIIYARNMASIADQDKTQYEEYWNDVDRSMEKFLNNKKTKK